MVVFLAVAAHRDPACEFFRACGFQGVSWGVGESLNARLGVTECDGVTQCETRGVWDRSSL